MRTHISQYTRRHIYTCGMGFTTPGGLWSRSISLNISMRTHIQQYQDTYVPVAWVLLHQGTLVAQDTLMCLKMYVCMYVYQRVCVQYICVQYVCICIYTDRKRGRCMHVCFKRVSEREGVVYMYIQKREREREREMEERERESDVYMYI